MEKRESMYSEASFKNSLKNETAKKKADKKDKDDAEEKEELTDEEKDVLDYQLQRGMDMVRAMAKLKTRVVVPVSVSDGEEMTTEGKGDKPAKDDNIRAENAEQGKGKK